jgi:hypothetical protein
MTGISTQNFHSFFNIDDFALVTGTKLGVQANWEANQVDYKPDGRRGYHHLPEFTGLEKNHRGHYSPEEGWLGRDISDDHEVMAFIARPRSKALGSQNISTISSFSLKSDLRFPFGDAQTEHSGQYQRPIQKTHLFFNKLLESLDIEFNPLLESEL